MNSILTAYKRYIHMPLFTDTRAIQIVWKSKLNIEEITSRLPAVLFS